MTILQKILKNIEISYFKSIFMIYSLNYIIFLKINKIKYKFIYFKLKKNL